MRVKTSGFELSDKKLPQKEIGKIRDSLYRYIDDIREYGDVQIKYEMMRQIVRLLIGVSNVLVIGYFVSVLLVILGIKPLFYSIMLPVGIGLILLKFYLFKLDCVITRNIISSGITIRSKMINMGLKNPVVYKSDIHLKYMYLILYRMLSRYLESVKLPIISRINKQFRDIITVRFVINLSDTCNLLSKSGNLGLQERDNYEFWGLYKALILEYEILRDIVWIYLSNNEHKRQYKNSLETKLLMMNPDLFMHLLVDHH